jgi:hypothetical protein
MTLSNTSIEEYKDYLIKGTYEGSGKTEIDFKSRYDSLKIIHDAIEKNNFKDVLELGTCRSFMDGAYEGCNKDDIKFWNEADPQKWDWGAGAFSVVLCRCFNSINITTVDLIESHINRCKVMTKKYDNNFKYVVSDSLKFLNETEKKFDIIYVDTGDMTPIEPTAKLQLEEAMIICKRNLLKEGGLILIDDVKNQTPKKFGEISELGKSKYSLDYFCKHGYEIVFAGYQYILRKV